MKSSALSHTIYNNGSFLGAVFLVTFLTMGFDLWAAIIIMVSVGMILIHMIGSMAVAGISANAVSLVNLVMVSTYTVCVYDIISSCMHLVG